MNAMDNPRMSLRTYLVLVAMRDSSCSMVVAMEAVASTALANPEWDMEERRPFEEWQAWENSPS